LKICPTPTSLPRIREQFSKEFIAELKKCQSGDTDQIAHFTATTFFAELPKIIGILTAMVVQLHVSLILF
jgi:hypothetical protein